LSNILGGSHNTYGLIFGLTTMAGMILRKPENGEKYMVEGTERLDHDGMEANNRYVSIRLTGKAALS
jgi:hypothetical protein